MVCVCLVYNRARSLIHDIFDETRAILYPSGLEIMFALLRLFVTEIWIFMGRLGDIFKCRHCNDYKNLDYNGNVRGVCDYCLH